jgi:hypothetical protein
MVPDLYGRYEADDSAPFARNVHQGYDARSRFLSAAWSQPAITVLTRKSVDRPLAKRPVFDRADIHEIMECPGSGRLSIKAERPPEVLISSNKHVVFGHIGCSYT